MEEKIQELERFAVIGKIFPSIFHDILNPLTGLILYIDTLEKRLGLNLEMKDQIVLAEESGEKIRDFIKIIQKFIHGEQTETLDVDVIVQDVMKLMSSKARLKDAKINFIRANRTFIQCPTIFIYQIMINLISNSIDAFDDNSEKDNRINIIIENNENYITIRVSDNGQGIEKVNEKNIFQPFYTTREKGTGTGLATIKNIVDKELKGKISVKSKIGVGTEFKIQIPIKNPE